MSTEQKRLFIGIYLSREVYARIRDLIQKLCLDVDQKNLIISWTLEENLHHTIKFLGSTKQELVPSIQKILLKIVMQYKPLEIKTQGLGVFPNEFRPQVLWVGLEDQTNQLLSLAKDIEKELETIGFLREQRQYTPHLTIGRIRKGRDVKDWLKLYKTTDFGSSEVKKIILFESIQQKHQQEYKILFEAPLTSH